VNIGLVTDTNGYPISVEILEGNINDKSTLQSKVNELKERFIFKINYKVGQSCIHSYNKVIMEKEFFEKKCKTSFIYFEKLKFIKKDNQNISNQ
ncbi:hypothetical protein VAMP_8n334, partial [Candidatus Vampirococcus lugosii]